MPWHEFREGQQPLCPDLIRSHSSLGAHVTPPLNLLEALWLVQPVGHLQRLSVLSFGWQAELNHTLRRRLVGLQTPPTPRELVSTSTVNSFAATAVVP